MNIFYDGGAKQINVLDERFYESTTNPGIYYPGVTTVLEAYYKGYGYHEWLKQVGFNADEILKKAGNQGKNVHAMIDFYLKGLPVKWANNEGGILWTLAEWQMFCKFIEFFNKFNPEIIVNEFQLVSEKLRFGGTIDLVCKINDEIWLIDYKTSNYIHKTHELQIAAYSIAWNELNPQYEIKRAGILWLKSSTRGEDKSGIKIQGQEWQIKEFDRNYKDAFKLFEYTQAIWNEENPNYKPKNLIYPGEFMREKTPDLKAKEDFIYIQEEKRKSELKIVRENELQPYAEFVPLGLDFSNMDEENYLKILNGAKLQLQAKLDLEAKVEADRVAKEKAESEERKRIKIENERLKAESKRKKNNLLKNWLKLKWNAAKQLKKRHVKNAKNQSEN